MAVIIMILSLLTTTFGQQFPPVTYLTSQQVGSLFERDITQNPTVGRINGTIDVSPTGAASYTIPLSVPPGTAGIQPNLSIVYNSQFNNGIMGIGWNPSCYSAITRVQHNFYNDGDVQPTDGPFDDRFSIDGNRLIEIPGGSGNIKYYHTELETFSKITRDGNLYDCEFVVETKDGKTLYYGTSWDSKVSGYHKPLDLQPDFRGTNIWYLKKVVDNNGNYFEYFYNEIPIYDMETEPILDRIEYTLNNGAQVSPNIIKFNYSIRSDQFASYFAGRKMPHNLLLTSIEMVSNATLVRTYSFSYTLDTYSHLTQILESSDPQAINSTVIKWGSETYHNEIFDAFNSGKLENVQIGDFNGDGLSDVAHVYSNNGTPILHIKKSNGNISPSQFQDLYSEVLNYFPNGYSKVGDLNSDGVEDILFAYFQGNGDIRLDALVAPGTSLTYTNPYTHILSQSVYPNIKGITIGNFNGDGYTDILIAYNSKDYAILNIQGNQLITIYQGLLINFDHWGQLYPLDFDGDGLTELLNVYSASYGSGTIFKFNNNQYQNIGGKMPFTSLQEDPKLQVYIGDLNGDGKSDVIWRSDDQGEGIHASYSNGFDFTPKFFAAPFYGNCDFGEYRLFVADYNGDGKSDILHIYPTENHCYHHPAIGGPLMHQYYVSYAINYSVGSHVNNNGGQYEQGDFNTETFNEYGNRDVNDACYHFGDFNGDGAYELFYSYWYDDHYDNNPSKIYYFHRDEQKHFPTLIMDGFNLISSFYFTTLSKGDNYTRENTENNHIVIDWTGPLKVIKSIRIPSGIGTSVALIYKYKGAKIHLQGKGFLGFSEFSSTNLSSNIEITDSYSRLPVFYYPVLVSRKSNHPQLGDISFLSNRWDVHDFMDKRFCPYIMMQTSTNYLQLTQSTSTFDVNLEGNLISSIVTNSSGNGQNYIEDGHVESKFNFIHPNPGGTGNITPYLCNRSENKKTNTQGDFTVIKKYQFDSRGNLKSQQQVDPANQNTYFTSIEYERSNPFGLITKITTSSPNLPAQTSFEHLEYELNNKFLIKKTNSLGNLYYNKTFNELTGDMESETDVNGNITLYTYDKFSNPLQIIPPLDFGYPTKITYNWYDNVSVPIDGHPIYKTTIITPEKPTSTDYFDGFERMIQSEQNVFSLSTPKIVVNTKKYNDLGQLVSVSKPYFSTELPQDIKWVNYTYTPVGRLETESFLDQSTSYLYENQLTTITGSDLVPSSKKINSLGQLVEANDNGGTINYTYHPSGQVNKIEFNGNITEMKYDASTGQQVLLIDPDSKTTSYKYNDFGQLEFQEDANSNVYEMKYDCLGRLINKKILNIGDPTNTNYQIGDDINYQYKVSGDGIGQLESVTVNSNNNITTDREYFYLSDGRQYQSTRYIDNIPFNTTLLYKQNSSNIENYSYPSGFSLNYIYNSDGFVIKIIQPDTQESIWTRGEENASGLQTNESLGQNINCVYQYNDYNQLKEVSMGNVYHYAFGYDPITGNLKNRSNIIDPNIARVENFTYDPLHRLKLTIKNYDVPPTMEMDYGSDGNILSKSDIGNYIYDPNTPHAVSSINDPLITPPHQTVNYTPFNKAFRVNQDDDLQQYQLDITYGTDEQRSKTELIEIINTVPVKVYTRYFDGDYEEEIRYTGVTALPKKQFHYIYIGNRLIAIGIKEAGTSPPLMHYVCLDHQGSIMGLMNKTGAMEEEYSYDAWGNRRDPLTWNSTPSIPNLIYRGYTGHEHLDEFNLINMNGRIYDPSIGRFFSPDNYIQKSDYSQSFNRYSYCLNNPLTYTDPSGEIVWFIPVIIGAVIGTYTGGVMANVGHYNPAKWDYNSGKTWGYMFGGAVVGAVSGYAGWAIAGSGIPMANTAAIAGASLTNSIGTNVYTGGQTPITMSVGGASYDFTNGTFGYLGKEGNSALSNIGYGFGALANVQDIVSLLRGGGQNITVNSATTKDGHHWWGHSSITNEDSQALISVGPDEQVQVGENIYQTYQNSIKGANVDWATYLGEKGTWSIELNNVSTTAICKYYSGITRWDLLLNSCVGHTTRALWSAGIPTIFALHPYMLNLQLLVRQIGIYSSPYLYQIP